MLRNRGSFRKTRSRKWTLLSRDLWCWLGPGVSFQVVETWVVGGDVMRGLRTDVVKRVGTVVEAGDTVTITL